MTPQPQPSEFILATDSKGNLYSVSNNLEQIHWQLSLGDNNLERPVICNGTSYIATDPHTVKAVDLSRKQILSEQVLSGDDRLATQLISNEKHSLIYAITKTGIRAIDVDTNKAVWRASIPCDRPPRLGVNSERLYYPHKSCVISLDATNGDKIWEKDIGDVNTETPVTATEDELYVQCSPSVFSSPIAGDSSQDVPLGDGSSPSPDVLFLDLEGTIVGECKIDAKAHCPIASTPSSLFIGTTHELICIDIGRAAKKWSAPLENRPHNSHPHTVSGSVIMEDGDNKVKCFDQQTGDLEWFVKRDHVVIATTVSRNRLYITGANGQISAYSLDTGNQIYSPHGGLCQLALPGHTVSPIRHITGF
jgi:outer membrane protein assembly factor BamB